MFRANVVERQSEQGHNLLGTSRAVERISAQEPK